MDLVNIVQALDLDSASPARQFADPVDPTSINDTLDLAADLNLHLPDPNDDQLPELDFQQQVEVAWHVCDRFDLQTDIWRGRILRVIRDREKRQGDNRGSGFLNWLKDRELSKSQAYSLIELADSADALFSQQSLEPEAIDRFSKRAFVETAQAPPEVQQMITESAQQGQRITRRQVRELSDQWAAMTSELVPAEIKTKAATHSIPTRYVAPLVRELEKLPELHQQSLQTELAANPDVETLKQATSEARYLARYLEAASRVQALTSDPNLDLETALAEAMRLGSLNLTADLMNQAAQLEQLLAKLYTTWTRVNQLSEKLYLSTGASTPHLRALLDCLDQLTDSAIEITVGSDVNCHRVRIRIEVNPFANPVDPVHPE